MIASSWAPTALVAVAALSLAAAAALAAAPAVAPPAGRHVAYAEGAPPGFAGGFGESSCHACHFDFDVNASPGELTIAGVPDRFEPGRPYPLTIRVSRPGLKMAGFQLTARLEEGGAQAGALAPGEAEAERVVVEAQGDVQYASQRRTGATPSGPDTAMWRVVWTAPPAPLGPVQIHVAANAANHDESVSGDYVYTAVARTRP